jgi:superfamily II DNA or RNA helicase
MMRRFSSRLQKLDATYLNDVLRGASRYDRIAGYFGSSLLEIAGEAVEAVTGTVRIICNSDLHPQDVVTARAAEQALKREWTSKVDAQLPVLGKSRFGRLYELLQSGKLEVRVLPNEYYGLIHGKAGVITRADGSQTAFLGSVNETLSAWKLNYELLWEDSSAEAVAWVQAEFDALWHDPRIVKLSDAVVEDIGRLAKRFVVTLPTWTATAEPAAAVIEAPVYRKEYGLWAHQKYFVDLAFREHISGRGARLVLADMVGLGKTVQLALAALLMTLWGEKPVLIVVPKTLLWQWQEEMSTLLHLPSAVWDGRRWVDEQGIKHLAAGPEQLRRCPRRVGLVSQGLLTRGGAAADHLLAQQYECVIVDECHRARRKNLKRDGENEPADPNNLLRFLQRIALQTKSLLLGTATPVQLYPIEAYDLLDVLGQGNEHVLGNANSIWRKDRRRTLALVMGHEAPPTEVEELWDYARNPLPQTSENPALFGMIRDELNLPANTAVAAGPQLEQLRWAYRHRLANAGPALFQEYNPFIRHIVRRTRDFLEDTVDPATGEPYLKKVSVRLFGEEEREAVMLPGYLESAYETAESFCRALARRKRSAGFLRMLLLKRMGSSIIAGKLTAQTLLANNWRPEELQEPAHEEADEEDDLATDDMATATVTPATLGLTNQELDLLRRLIRELDLHQERDPKYAKLKDLLTEQGWAARGCIIFSQYYDTAHYFAELLSSELPNESIGLYAGGSKSGRWLAGKFEPCPKEYLKRQVQSGELRILFGTDAASEGLNLQRLSTLINIDLPWNPTRLEQRKGRIQRIGQAHDEILIYNMRYRGSVEDKVHGMLSARLEHIHAMFGQLPDVLEDAWIQVALGEEKAARQIIDAVPQQHPFEMKYNRIESINWESCAQVLSEADKRNVLLKGW